MTNNYILSLGSNISEAYVENAAVWLGELLDDFCMSHIYDTPAVRSDVAEIDNTDTFADDAQLDNAESVADDVHIDNVLNRYSNAVVTGSSGFQLAELDTMLKNYETGCGRDAVARAEGRVPIDIDIVVCNGEVVRPWDFRQQFFRIGLLELAGSPV